MVETNGSTFKDSQLGQCNSPNNGDGTIDVRDRDTSAVTTASVVDGDSQKVATNSALPVRKGNCSRDFKS